MKVKNLHLINTKNLFFPGQKHLPEPGHVESVFKLVDFDIDENGSWVIFSFTYKKTNFNEKCLFLWQNINGKLQKIFPPEEVDITDFNIFGFQILKFELLGLQLKPLTLDFIKSINIFSSVFIDYGIDELNECYYNGLLLILKPYILQKVSNQQIFQKMLFTMKIFLRNIYNM